MRFFFLFLVLSASASAQVFWYSDEVDRRDSLDFAALSRFDGFEDSDFSFRKYNCISLDDYNSFAARNPYDGYDPVTADSDKSVLKRLRRDDLNRLADENSFDSLSRDDFGFSDMGCWALSDYNGFAGKDRDDSWKPASLRDPEHFDEIIHKVGVRRFHFFDAQKWMPFLAS